MGNNSEIKKKMIKKYGAKCFIEELGIRDKEEVQEELRYYGKGQRKIMDMLTYHHIIERCKGGLATEENGAILRNINHQWFNRLNKRQQREINEMFQEYKKNFYKECEVVYDDDIKIPIQVNGKIFMMTERELVTQIEQQKELQRDLMEEIRY